MRALVSPRPFSHLTDSGHEAPGGQGAERRPKQEAGSLPQPKRKAGSGEAPGPGALLRTEFAQQIHSFTSTACLPRVALVGGGLKWGQVLKPPKDNTSHSYSFGALTVINMEIEKWLLENLPGVRSETSPRIHGENSPGVYQKLGSHQMGREA